MEIGLFVTNFQSKTEIFNELFVQQCSLNQNKSALLRFISRCNTVLENVEINPSKVLKIIRSLDSNKAHAWDSLSISMIEICDAKIVIPLCLICEKCLATERFPEIWKKESRQIKDWNNEHFLLHCPRFLDDLENVLRLETWIGFLSY